MMIVISKPDLLAVLGDFDESGGASQDLAAWELSVEPSEIADSWRAIRAGNLVRYVGEDPMTSEPMYRLTAAGWADLHDPGAHAAPAVAGVQRDATSPTNARTSR